MESQNPREGNPNFRNERTLDTSSMKEDRQFLMFTHLSQLFAFITGMGGLIVPVILWQVKKDEILNLDEHGKAVVNFQISLLIYAFAGVILTFVLVGIIVIVAVMLLGLIYPIINGIKANDGKPVNYPLSIEFFK